MTVTTQWTHKGVGIELSGADFKFSLDGRIRHTASLIAAKKAIDKFQSEKAAQVVLDMPVVFWQESTWRAKCEEGIGRASVTGLDRHDGLKPQGLPEFSKNWIMPDSPENEQLIRDLVETKARVESLEEEIGKRDISFWFGHGYRGKPPDYGKAIKTLQQRWSDARKASGLDKEASDVR